MNTITNTKVPLTFKEANEIGGAIQELDNLCHKAIVEKDDSAKQNVLTSFVQDKLLLHAVEFLAAWFTMEQEYKPMIQAQATMFGHCLTIIQRREQVQQQAQQQAPLQAQQQTNTAGEDAAPANVIQLVTK